MSKIKSFSEIVNNMIERLRISQPNLDTKIGSVSRDLFIDIQADEIQKLYNLMSIISSKQSFATAGGRDLELIARNFGISRNTGSLASGIVVFTATNLNSEISIPEGTEVSTRSGVAFRTVGSYVLSPTQRNIYSSNASRLRSFLNKAGNRDSYALEIPVQAVSRGTSSNVSAYQINQNAGPLELNVVNTQATSGGGNSESDSAFRARIFSLFNGSNTGTSIGYKNAAIGTSGVVDALVVEPGSSLMLRDGSEVISSNDGNLSVVNSGTGGKVDLYILGSDLVQVSETFLFRDKSSDNNISDNKNDLILGYSNQDLLSTNLQRRKDAYNTGNFPLQPINSIVSVQGSMSGLLIEEGSDNANFRLVKDYNPDTGGSPFGQDKIKFISNTKFISGEQVSKKNTSTGDNIKFFNVKNIDLVYQDILIEDEKAEVSQDDRSVISLRNYPIVSISSIRNQNTGEQYGYTSLNFEDEINSIGEIKIYGNKLPTIGEVVSVNYTSRFYFDESINFQSKSNYYFANNEISDKVYWGPNDYIEKEEAFVSRNSDDSSYIADLSNNIEDVISAYSFESESDIKIQKDDLGFYIDLKNTVKNIIKIFDSNNVNLVLKDPNSFIFKNKRIYFPISIEVLEEQSINIEYNRVDFFNLESSSGTFYDNRIVFPSDNSLSDNNIFNKLSSIVDSGSSISFDYIASKGNIFSSQDLSSFPILGSNQTNSLSSSSSGQISDSYQPIEYSFSAGIIEKIKRFSPCRLAIDLDSNFSNGLIRISGETLTKISVEMPGSFFDGETFDLSGAIKEFLGKTYVPDNVRVCKVSKVFLDGKDYDIIGYSLSDNIFDKEVAISDSGLNNYSFKISNTSKNKSIMHSSGSLFNIDFYIETLEDFEDISYISSGVKYTNKLFSRISSIDIISGFRNQEGALDGLATIFRLDKPSLGSAYFCDYKFKSPQDGERLTVNYTTNRLIIDVSRSIEGVRTITSDILVKEAESITVDCNARIVVSDELSESENIIIENVINQITNSLNSTKLGGHISISDVISSASSVSGVEAISVDKFCESGDLVKAPFIKALDNQTIVPGSIEVIRVSRRNFL